MFEENKIGRLTRRSKHILKNQLYLLCWKYSFSGWHARGNQVEKEHMKEKLKKVSDLKENDVFALLIINK